MILILKCILTIAFGAILYQDVKERLVYWFLFPIVALCIGWLFYSNTLPELFLASIIANLMFVSTLLLIVFLYSKFKLNMKFDQVIGLGDILFFLAVCFSFSTLSFLVVFISALVFSLILHLSVKNKKRSFVPLAGYMSLFFGLAYLGHWTGIIHSVYQF